MSTKLRIDFVTIFPRMIEPLLAEGVISRGVKQGIIDIQIRDLREYATDKHRSTDDEAYGGGPGMVMLVEPVLRAIEAAGDGTRLAIALRQVTPGSAGAQHEEDAVENLAIVRPGPAILLTPSSRQ